MTPDAAVEFLALGYVTSRTVADMRIANARKHGATEAECAEALAAWEQLQAESVQRIESQPAFAPLCKCSHPPHDYLCSHRACGCRRTTPERRTDAPSVNEYLRSKGEL